MRMDKDRRYSITVNSCSSEENMTKLFDEIIKLVFTINPNLIQLKFSGSLFGRNSMKIFSEHRWEKL